MPVGESKSCESPFIQHSKLSKINQPVPPTPPLRQPTATPLAGLCTACRVTFRLCRMLAKEEYVEQAYMFKALMERMSADEPVQDLLGYLKEEVLSTTKLPLAIDFLLAEVKQLGTMATAMKRLAHYFTPFQCFLVSTAEEERGSFDMRIALELLYHEAKLRSDDAGCISMFFYQFETLCRHSLDYDYGMQAIAGDAVYDTRWQKWILNIRRQIGMIEIANIVYLHSEHYLNQKADHEDTPEVVLFGEKEGRIAFANRQKEPHYLFLALQRQLGYPPVPVRKKPDGQEDLIPKLKRTVERLEVRMKLLEEEQRSAGIDLSKFYKDQK